MKVVNAGYQMAEVGLIPEDWDVQTLKDLAEKVMVGIASAATHAYTNKGIPLLRNQNIKENRLDDSDILFVKHDYELQFKNKRLKAGDLLTARTGYPGTTCIIPEKYHDAQSFTTLITRLKGDNVNHNYVAYYINSQGGQRFFEQNQIGGGQKNVNANTLKKMPIPLPPTLTEQKAIATSLSDVDALISSLDKLIEKKKAIKQGAMQELLTGKADSNIVKLGKYSEMSSGGTPSSKVDEYYNGDIIWISISDITNSGKYIDTSVKKITRKGLENSSAKIFPRGTVFLAMYASIGKCCIITKEASTSQAILGISPNSRLLNEYLYYFLLHHKDSIANQGQQGTQSNLNKGMVQDLDIILPSIDVQNEIVEVLSTMDAEIEKLEIKRDKYMLIKQGMMQELLTGKTRLI